MSLFPAYAPDLSKDVEDSTSGEEWSVPAALESQLLASDEEPPAPAKRARPAPRPPTPPLDDFYLDTDIDYGNLRVSTLYYPGRPEYRSSAVALGGRAERKSATRRRYWQSGAPPPPAETGAAGARAAALRAALAADPADEELWLRYVDFQEEWGARGAGLEAAREAAAACASRRVRAALHRARERHLPPDRLRLALRDELAAERRPRVRLELWTRLLEAVGAAGADAVAAAALAHLAADADAYPRLVYAHGCVLRAAGLWERLVLAVELTAAMSFPPAPAFPPPRDLAAERRRDAALQAREDEVCASGLPLNAVWARVERLRAAAHWRPAPDAAGGDPQRAPAAAAAAELLRPVRSARAGAALALALLRLARVPLPGGEHAARAAGPEPSAGEPALPESLAVLLRAARRLPPAHPARAPHPAAARAALAPLLDPPHYFSDADGYLTWTNALWEACCGWMEGERRLAFVCWRLRWLHTLARLAEPAEARRLRHEARAAIKRHAPAAPEAFAHFARLEADVASGAAGARAAAAALRAALRDAAAPPERALFAARVVAELQEGGAGAAPARWALCCAALRRPLPPDEELAAPPPAPLVAAALERCAARCDELELRFAAAELGEDEEDEGDVCAALLPGAGEWAAARATLACPAERARLLARLLQDRRLYRGGAALQYGEQAACALALGLAGGARAAAARSLLPMFPGNPLLALMCAGAPVWAGAPAPAPSARAALASVLPRLLRAPLAGDAEPAEAGRLGRACARLARRGGGPLLAALRLEAEARSPRHRTAPALYAALDDHPAHKWVYVRGAAWCGAEAAALADALLERGLRLHALLDELPPAAASALPPALPPAAASVLPPALPPAAASALPPALPPASPDHDRPEHAHETQ